MAAFTLGNLTGSFPLCLTQPKLNDFEKWQMWLCIFMVENRVITGFNANYTRTIDLLTELLVGLLSLIMYGYLEALLGEGGGHVACLNFKTSCVSVYKMLVAYCHLCRHCRNLAEGGCLLSRFHFTRCHYFLGHVACRNLPWQGLYLWTLPSSCVFHLSLGFQRNCPLLEQPQ